MLRDDRVGRLEPSVVKDWTCSPCVSTSLDIGEVTHCYHQLLVVTGCKVIWGLGIEVCWLQTIRCSINSSLKNDLWIIHSSQDLFSYLYLFMGLVPFLCSLLYKGNRNVWAEHNRSLSFDAAFFEIDFFILFIVQLLHGKIYCSLSHIYLYLLIQFYCIK